MRFKQDQWQQFADLLAHGYTLKQSLDLLNQNSTYILSCITKGERFETLLMENSKGKMKHHLSFFIHLTSLSDAIKSAIAMTTMEHNMMNKVKKQTAYPIGIFVMSFFTIFLFSNYIIPQLLSSFDAQNEHLLFSLVTFIKILSVWFILLVVGILIILMILKKNKLFHLYSFRFANRFFFTRDLLSYRICGYLLALHERGLSSKQSFQFLMRLQTDTYLSYIVNEINNDLNDGLELLKIIQQHRYFNKRFKANFLIGANNGKIEQSLHSFMEQQESIWISQIKRFSIIIQILAYAFVGILIICVYQIMLIPLQILEEL